MNLIPGRRQSVEYLANYFIFICFGFFFLLIYTCANFPEKDNKTLKVLIAITREVY